MALAVLESTDFARAYLATANDLDGRGSQSVVSLSRQSSVRDFQLAWEPGMRFGLMGRLLRLWLESKWKISSYDGTSLAVFRFEFSILGISEGVRVYDTHLSRSLWRGAQEFMIEAGG